MECTGKLRFYSNFELIRLGNLHQAILEDDIDLKTEKYIRFVSYDENDEKLIIRIPTNEIICIENEDSEEGYCDYFEHEGQILLEKSSTLTPSGLDSQLPSLSNEVCHTLMKSFVISLFKKSISFITNN